MALKIGQKAPAWSGVNQHGESISSDQYLGKKVILFFYPKAMTLDITWFHFLGWYNCDPKG